ncbi:MAG TPA: TonB-dependent receptor, partial [Sphingomicrobium sp.]|nr:TonB-dependent receptor [Sphingomicrobium sp.]
MRKSMWLLSAGLVALSMPAYAQETDTDAGGAQPTQGATAEAAAVDNQDVEPEAGSRDTSEIVVTATRRNEALSDVPLAVSAVTAETLQNSGASDIRALTQLSPSLLVFSTSSEAGAGRANIRGIGTVGDNPGLESSVAVFIDGVYRSRTGVGLTELGAIDRIEVLRGPQGTLFGRNASAGLISIITAKPKFRTEVGGELSIGNYDFRRAEAYATGGLSETIAARIDGVWMQRDGFLEDDISGRDVNNRDRWMLRGQLLFEPSSDLSIRVVGDYAKRDEECCAAPYLPAFDYTGTKQPSSIKAIEEGLGAIINDDPFDRDVSITPDRSFRSDVKDYGVSGELVYDLGGAELTSISAYRYNKYIRGQDIDFNNLDIAYRPDDGSVFNRFKTFTQELRLQGEAFDGRLDWLVGGYYANEKLRVDDTVAYGDDFQRYGNCLLFASALPAALMPTETGNCINSTVVNGALGQIAAGITQLNTAIAQLQALPQPLPPAQQALLNSLIAQRNALLAQQAQVGLISQGWASIGTAVGLGPTPFAGVMLHDTYNQTSNNWALFTHNIFDITDQLTLTVGARYTHEKKKVEVDLADNNSICTAIAGTPALTSLQAFPCSLIASIPGGLSDSDSKSEGKLSGTVVLSFKPADNVLTYLSYSRGYKAGGYNLDRSAFRRSNGNGAVCVTASQSGCGGVAASFDDLKFKPETNDAIELGMKYNGRGFDLNIAAFHQLFRNFQLNTFNGLNFIVENINSCENDLSNTDEDNSAITGECDGKLRAGVKNYGIEIEAFTRPFEDVSINGGFVYASTRYRDDLVGSGGRPLTPALFQLPGRRLSGSNAVTLTGSASWTPPIGGSGMRGLVYVDARHMSHLNTGSDLDIEKIQDAYTVVNARVGLRGPDDRWAVELWAQNLFDNDNMQVA